MERFLSQVATCKSFRITIFHNLCPDEEKGCSARDLMIIESCRAENLLSNDIKYVMIGKVFTELHIPEHATVGILRNRKMPNYLLFIDILGENH